MILERDRDSEPDPVPSGMPAEEEDQEPQPLGVPEADPDGEDAPARGEDAMPGMPTEGEPPTAG